MTRLALATMVTVVAIGVLLVASFPFRAILEQQEATSASEARISALDEDIAVLEDRLAALEDEDAIKLMARRHFDRVEVGEEAYRIPPVVDPPLPVPSGWPFHLVDPANP